MQVFSLSHFPDSNRGPTHYECVALPTEPKWQSLFKKRSGYFRLKANAKVRQISNVAKYFLQKAEKIYFFRVVGILFVVLLKR